MLSRLVSRSSRQLISKRNYSKSAFRLSSSTTSTSTSTQKYEFNWADRARSAPVSLVAAYKEASSRINDLKTGASTDIKVPAIDWSYWEKEISDKSAVAKLKKEYESQKFDEHSVSETDIQAKNKVYDEQIVAAEQRMANNTKEIKELEKDLEFHQYYFDHPDRVDLSVLYKLVPGVEEELQQQWWSGHYNLDPEERKNDAWDPATLSNYFEAGGRLEELPLSLLPPHIPQKHGNVDLLEEAEKIAKKYGKTLDRSLLPKFRQPKDHHDLLPLLQERKDGAPVFGAPVPGHPEGSQSH